MFLDPTKYDRTIGHNLNVRRREEVSRRGFDETVAANRRVGHIAEFEHRSVVKGRMAYVSMRVEDLRRKNQLQIDCRRDRLRALFAAEDAAYRQAVRDAVPTEAQRIAAMEDEYGRITAANREHTGALVADKREQAWQSNCDELRRADELLRARACKLSWDVQNVERQRQRTRARLEAQAWGDIAKEDLRQHLVDEAQRVADERARVAENRQALLDQLDQRQRRAAEDAYEERLRQEREAATRAVGQQLADLGAQQALQEQMHNRQQLLVQMKLDDIARRAGAARAQDEGRDAAARLRRELQADADRAFHDRESLRKEQLLYLELLRLRREQAARDRRTLEDYFVGLMRGGAAAQQAREDGEAALRRRLAQDCADENLRRSLAQLDAREADRLEKARVLAAALQDLEAFEREKADALAADALRARQFAAFLQAQTREGQARRDAAVEDDRAYARQQQQAVADDEAKIRARLGEIEGRLQDMDGVKYWDDERPQPKKQWYN